MAIRLRTPINQERLVPDTTAIIVDADTAFSRVQVGADIAYLLGVFGTGWSGLFIELDDGTKRISLVRATPFELGEIVTVTVQTLLALETFTFEVGTAQITETHDTTTPRVEQIGDDDTWVAYVREPGVIVLRRDDDPIGAEVFVLEGDEVDVGYDESLGKLVLIWVHNGKVFYSLADPADSPASLTQPSTLNSASRLPDGGDGDGYSTGVVTSFAPLKFVATDAIPPLPDGGDGDGYSTGIPSSVTPVILSVPPDPVWLRIPRPTTYSKVKGFIVWKFSHGSPRALGFVALQEGALFVDILDPQPTPRAVYAVQTVYYQGDSLGEVKSGFGGLDSPPTAGARILLPDGGDGDGPSTGTITTFAPVKLAYIDPDPIRLPDGGDGDGYSIAVEGFDPIGVG